MIPYNTLIQTKEYWKETIENYNFRVKNNCEEDVSEIVDKIMEMKNAVLHDVVRQSEQLRLTRGGHYNCPECGESLHVSDYEHKCWV